MKLRKAVHMVYETQYHLVWITRDRRKILVTEVRSYLLIKLQAIRIYYPDGEYTEMGIKNDHIHLFIIYGNSSVVCGK